MNTSITFDWYKKLLCLLGLITASCTDFVKVDMPNYEISSQTVFNDDATAKSAMIGLYIELSKQPVFTNSAIPVLTGLSSDELITTLPDYLQFEENNLTSDNPRLLSDLWKPAYRYIYMANVIIEGLHQSTSNVSPKLRQQLEGEARFIRAYSYFFLTNLFGNVPLVMSSNWEQNNGIGRSNIDQVYEVIHSDLSIAKDLLPSVYPTEGGQEKRIWLTSWSALALQSKTYLFQGNWAAAAISATQVIDNSQALFALEQNLNKVFINQSKEVIWQIQPVTPLLGTWEANIFISTNMPGFMVSDQLLNSFESGDKRKYAWLDSLENGTDHPYYYPHKYKAQHRTEESHVELRLADILLIRAEARANLDDYEGACADVDSIRSRAGLPLMSKINLTREKLIKAIHQERKVELFTEGNLWFDLKRYGKADSVLAEVDYKRWDATDILYPVPQSEITKNTNLRPQNEGY